MKVWAATVIMAATVLAESLTAPLLIRPHGSDEVLPYGAISYNVDTNQAVYSNEPLSEYTGRACIGVESAGAEFVCLAYGDILAQAHEHFVLYLDGDGSIAKLDYSRNHSSTGSSVEIAPMSKPGPQPQLKAPIKLVGNKLPEPEVEKSFLQKYWVYMVPVLLMMMATGGGGQ